MMDIAMSPDARSVVERVLAEESAKRDHLVVALSGAHAYGFPSPDSDFDLKAVHVESTDRLLGLGSVPLHADRMEVIETGGFHRVVTATLLGPGGGAE